MAHGFINKGKQTTFVSKKEIPWHGLGKIVDVMTSAEAMKLGGLDFEVAKVPLYFKNQNLIPFSEAPNHDTLSRTKTEEGTVTQIVYQELKLVPDAFTMIRTDTQHPFGYVGKKYEPIQNAEAFEFFDSIIGHGHAQYETVGALGNGEVVFITAKLPDYMEVRKDQIDKYLLFSMSHNGSSAISIMFTPIRVVCNNTLSMALSGKVGRNKISIMHTKNARQRIELGKEILGLVDHQTYSMQNLWNQWGTDYVNDKDATKIFELALGRKRDDKGKLSTQSENIMKSIEKYYREGFGQEEYVGTKWGVYNAITGYLQNVKSYSDSDIKFKNTFLSGDSDVRNRAAELLLL